MVGGSNRRKHLTPDARQSETESLTDDYSHLESRTYSSGLTDSTSLRKPLELPPQGIDSGIFPQSGMYLSSIPYWNASFCDIPQQFMTTPEPFSTISMGSKMPLYSMNRSIEHSLVYSSLPPSCIATSISSSFDPQTGMSKTQNIGSTFRQFDWSTGTDDVSSKVSDISSGSKSKLPSISDSGESSLNLNTQS